MAIDATQQGFTKLCYNDVIEEADGSFSRQRRIRPESVQQGLDASTVMGDLLALLRPNRFDHPVLYRDMSGEIFSPEVTTNPQTGQIQRGYKSWTSGQSYTPSGPFGLLDELPSIILGQTRVRIRYAEAEFTTPFLQPSEGGIVALTPTTPVTDGQEQLVEVGSTVLILSASGDEVAGHFEVMAGSSASALQLKRLPDFLAGDQTVVADGATLSEGRVVAMSTLDAPTDAAWACLEFHASRALLTHAMDCPQYSLLYANARLAATSFAPSDLYSERGVKLYQQDCSRLMIPSSRFDQFCMLGLASSEVSPAAFATIIYGKGKPLWQ